MAQFEYPQPPHMSPDMMGDPEQDRANIRNPEIRETIMELCRGARLRFGKYESVVDALDMVTQIVDEEEPSVRFFCALISRIEERELPHMADVPNEAKEAISQFLSHARRKMGQALDQFRDPTVPLVPHGFVRLNSLKFPEFEGKPWYVGGFQYLDPHAGTTGGSHVPHLVMVRTPEFVDTSDVRFGGDFFMNERYLERQVRDDRPFKMRAHSACFMGECFAHDRCDCETQLFHAMREIEENKLGAVVYLQQEARGAGLFEKLRFYGLVDGRDRRGEWIGRGKYDTSTSMTVLGHRDEMREYWYAVRALRGIGIHPKTTPVTMITNNPNKLKPFQDAGYTMERVAGALESVRSAEAASEVILLKIIDQKHPVPWEQLRDFLEPRLDKIAQGQIDQVDVRVRVALTQLGFHLQDGNAQNCPPELAERVRDLWSVLQKDATSQDA